MQLRTIRRLGVTTALIACHATSQAMDSKASYTLRDHRAVPMGSGLASVQIDTLLQIDVRTWLLLGDPVVTCTARWSIDGEIPDARPAAAAGDAAVPRFSTMVELLAAQIAVPIGVGGATHYLPCDVGVPGTGDGRDTSLSVPGSPDWASYLMHWDESWPAAGRDKPFWWTGLARFEGATAARSLAKTRGFGLLGAPDGARLLHLQFGTAKLREYVFARRSTALQARLDTLKRAGAQSDEYAKVSDAMTATRSAYGKAIADWLATSNDGTAAARRRFDLGVAHLACGANLLTPGTPRCPDPALEDIRALDREWQAHARSRDLAKRPGIESAKPTPIAGNTIRAKTDAPPAPRSTAASATQPTQSSAPASSTTAQRPTAPAAPPDPLTCSGLSVAMQRQMLEKVAAMKPTQDFTSFNVVGNWLLAAAPRGCIEYSVGSGEKKYPAKTKLSYFDQSSQASWSQGSWRMVFNSQTQALASYSVEAQVNGSGEAMILLDESSRKPDKRYQFFGTELEYWVAILLD